MTPGRLTLFTVGHSTHSLEGLVDLLIPHGVRQLADVRAHPGSRRLPHFSADRLAASLPEQGVVYRHLPRLGGRRRKQPDSPNRAWENESFRAYADHLGSEEFQGGLAELEGMAREARTAMMCSEGLWWRCHRRLVADVLVTRSWSVQHIGPDGRLTEHELTEFAEVADGRVTYPARGQLFE